MGRAAAAAFLGLDIIIAKRFATYLLKRGSTHTHTLSLSPWEKNVANYFS